MEFYDQLIKKQYSHNLNGKVVWYSQLSYYECLEYLVYSADPNFDITAWLENLFDEKDIIWKWINIKNLFELLKNTAFKGFFGKESKKEMTKKEMLKMKYEFVAHVIARCDKWSIDPLSLLKTYTPEQLNLFTDWWIYLLNEWDKKWQNKNKIKLDMEWTDNSERDRILEMTKKLESNLSNNE